MKMPVRSFAQTLGQMLADIAQCEFMHAKVDREREERDSAMT
jgi:hypothetical protein